MWDGILAKAFSYCAHNHSCLSLHLLFNFQDITSRQNISPVIQVKTMSNWMFSHGFLFGRTLLLIVVSMPTSYQPNLLNVILAPFCIHLATYHVKIHTKCWLCIMDASTWSMWKIEPPWQFGSGNLFYGTNRKYLHKNMEIMPMKTVGRKYCRLK